MRDIQRWMFNLVVVLAIQNFYLIMKSTMKLLKRGNTDTESRGKLGSLEKQAFRIDMFLQKRL